ncbi:MAG: Na+/H+ antiporter NhaA [Streptosporangiales bacterium]|nr:Na+/H+ antiporter NhaA [Streptosporangiales bacterium]
MTRPAVYPVRLGRRYTRHVAEALRTETLGGAIMLGAAVVALIWANSPWAAAYETVREVRIGPAALHLDLTLQEWAADGLLAIFFFIAGLEVKEEMVHGELSSLRSATLPIIAAVAGIVIPATIYTGVTWGVPGALDGWAIPTATDIALALAILAVTASSLPTSLRAFLLTLAVVDDLGAIAVIAIFYTEKLALGWLAAAVVLLVVYWVLQRRRVRAAWVYAPIAIAVWICVHTAGVHATVAGVMLGLLIRVWSHEDEEESPSERADHLFRPISAGLAVPAFALLSAGVALSPAGLGGVFTDRIGLGIFLGLVVGKLVGVLGGAWLAVRFGIARLSPDLSWRDIGAAGMLAGVGFTVSLLIGELAFPGTDRAELVTTAVLVASFVAGALAAILLHVRVRRRDAAVPAP